MRLFVLVMKGEKEVSRTPGVMLERMLVKITEALRIARINKGLTREQVFHATGIDVEQIELGKEEMSLSTFQELLNYYGMPINDFFRQLEKVEHITRTN